MIKRDKIIRIMTGVVLFSVTVLLPGCGNDGSGSNRPKPSVIFIGVDTLRADHLGCYGYHRPTSPNIDRFAEDAVLFKNCITPCPRTTQSVASIMTGKYPWEHGVRELHHDLPDGETTLAEVLKEAGYHTISVVATGVLYQKIDRGFDVVVDTKEEWKAEVTTDHAIRELEQAEEPYFLWVFYRDPHMPYQAHGLPFDSDYDGRFKHFLGFKEIPHGELFFKNPMTEREREHAVALYDSEILFLDREIGRLLDYIEERGDDPIIVFLSDHGESLGEHDYYFDHGDLLNQPSIRVPLIIKGLDFPGSRVEKTVRLIDVSPTVLNHLGRRPDIEVTGVDLAAHASDGGARLPAFSETGKTFYQEAYEVGRRHLEGIPGRLRSVVDNDRKLIYIPTREGISWELYDLESDPEELTNIFPRRPGPELSRMMRQLEEVAHSSGGDDEVPALTEEERRRLRALGYMN